MARSRSRSRDRSRRKYSSSDDSDYDRRKRSHKKKKRSSRSRSRSTESDRRRYRSKDSSRYRSGYDDESRSSSRSEKRDSKKKRSSRRDRSRDRSPDDRGRKESDRGRSERSSAREYNSRGTAGKQKDASESDSTLSGGNPGLSFKERVAKLAISSSENPDNEAPVQVEYKIDSEKVAEIDAQGFHQQAFSSNAFERGANRNSNSREVAGNNALGEQDNHTDAIFGSSLNPVSSGLSKSNGSTFLNKDSDDNIFGPSILIDQDKRTERWLEKLKFIRKKFVQQSV